MVFVQITQHSIKLHFQRSVFNVQHPNEDSWCVDMLCKVRLIFRGGTMTPAFQTQQTDLVLHRLSGSPPPFIVERAACRM
jgi:hypothetical protein